MHFPFHATQELIDKYEKRKGPGIENPTYAAMIEGMDRSIGQLIDTLDELGLAENTLVMFTSDNGPFAANVKPLRAEKGYLYEGGIRVPMIVRWPGTIKPESKTDCPVITMDIHATILDVCGLKPDPTNTPDGVTLKGLLSRQEDLTRDAIYFHYPNYAFHKKNRMGSSIRSGDYKLIKFYGDQEDVHELYNLKDDIGETKNLANDEASKRDALIAKLDAWLEETGASLPIRSQ